jgi:glyoxylase-like metal-dependent hydrolase (beta-lactamase superfamily II)
MSKIEIKLITGNSYYCSGKLSVGIILNPKNQTVILIDSGLDNSGAKAIDTAIKAKNWAVAAIINTHSHADHCGGNAYFQSQYPTIKIYATLFEGTLIDNPLLEGWYLNAGAEPIAELCNKFIQAHPSITTDIIPYYDEPIFINDARLEIITFPGHTPGTIGLININDRVLYSGDCIFSEDTLQKHGILFFTNIHDTKTSLDKLTAIHKNYDFCVLYHGGVKTINDVQSLVNLHKQKIQATEKFIFEHIRKNSPLSVASLIAAVMSSFNIPNDVCQYYLTRTCVNAYLTYLQQQGLIGFLVENGDLLTKPV